MSQRQILRGALVAIAVALLYIVFARLGLALASRAAQVTAVWPPTGFALFAVLLYRRPAIVGVLIGAFVANAMTAEPFGAAVGIAAGNTLEALLAVFILRRNGFDSALARARDVVMLIGALIAGPVVSATIGVTSLGLGGLQPLDALPALWWIWWLGDALGGLIFAPALLVWSRDETAPGAEAPEGFALLASALAASIAVFIVLPPVAAIEYFIFPFLAWGALRFGPRGTASVSLAVTAVAVWGTHSGSGPFAGAGPERGLVLLQLFMAAAAVTGLLLGAVSAQTRVAQRRAEVNEQRLRLAMAAAQIGVWDWDIATGNVVWSQELEPLHGLPRGGFAGTIDAWRAMVHPDDLPRVDAAIAAALEKRELYRAEVRLVGADGLTRWTDARGQVIVGEDGRPAHLVGVGIDVTERRELEEQLRGETRRKDEFLAMLGHELRNPLAPILHAAELLVGSGESGPASHVDIIRRQSRHLSRLVDDLLDLSRISSGKVTLERSVIPLVQVVTGAVDIWRHFIDQRRQQLHLALPAKPVWIDADPVRMTQVLANLLHNASKFTAEGGRIDVVAEVEEDTAVVRVRDSGTGMTAETLAHAFDLFVQGPPALDRAQGGLGLGLTLVRKLVELHGGTIGAKSEGEGKGSELTVRVPVAKAPAKLAPHFHPDDERSEEEGPPTHHPRSQGIPPPHSVRSRDDSDLSEAKPSDGVKPSKAAPPSNTAKRILVVEDNDDARRILVILLERAGHKALGVGDGVAALEAAREFAPEVVLLDIGLPRMNGYEVAAALRALPECFATTIIAVSGYGQPDDRARSHAAGFDHHLLKPVEPEALWAVVGRVR